MATLARILATVTMMVYLPVNKGPPSPGFINTKTCLDSRVASRGQQASHYSISLGRKENAMGSMDGAFPLLTGNEPEEPVSFCTAQPTPFGPQCLEGCPILVLGSSPPRSLKHCQECLGGGCRPATGLRPKVKSAPKLSKQHFNITEGHGCWVLGILGTMSIHSHVKVVQSCPTLELQGLYSPWDSPGQNTGAGSLSLGQGIFPTQGSNPGLPYCRRILYQLSHKNFHLSSR